MREATMRPLAYLPACFGRSLYIRPPRLVPRRLEDSHRRQPPGCLLLFDLGGSKQERAPVISDESTTSCSASIGRAER